MPNKQKILFVGCLYQSKKSSEPFDRYSEACEQTIIQSKKLFPHSCFELHMDESIPAETKNRLSCIAKVVIHQYPTLQNKFNVSLPSSAIMRRQNSGQLTKCMRLNVLFEEAWTKRYEYCIVLDVHDDFVHTAQLILSYLDAMTAEQQYLITQWKSRESDCPYDCTITKKKHQHFDAGLVISKKPYPSRQDMSFQEFCLAKIMRSPVKLVKGVEEMLIDEYLKSIDFYSLHESEITTMKHACKVADSFYNQTTTNQRIDRKPGASIVTKNHPPFSAQTNHLLGTNCDIYICTQIPQAFFKKKHAVAFVEESEPKKKRLNS
jgi:hypothetical protein